MNKLSILLGICIIVFVVLTCNALQAYDDNEDEEVVEWQNLTQTIDRTNNETIAATSSIVADDNSIEQHVKDEKTIDEAVFSYDSLFEIPASRQDSPSQILRRKGYTVSYNKINMQPNWVAWHLTADHTDGEWARPSGNAFHEDYEVPSPRATNYDYKGSGWSRGHLCPAGDNKWDSTAMYESFLLTNVCPQNDRLNSGDWNDIEQECRKWAKRFGDLYIVCGPIFYRQEHEIIGINEIPVPEAFFKVVLCLNGKPKGIGFICKNSDGNHKTDFYVNTIQQVERITGYQFFPLLPKELEKEVKSKASLEEW